MTDRKSIGELIDNGFGLRISRLIIFSIPVVGTFIVGLTAYAFNVTVNNFTNQLDNLNRTLEKLNANVDQLSDDIVQAKIDIARLQAERGQQ